MKNHSRVYSYSKTRLLTNFIFGSVWLAIALSYFIGSGIVRWNAYATALLGVVYISIFLYEYTQKYVVITRGQIILMTLPKVKIELNEIKSIDIRQNSVQLKTKSKSATIEISKVDKSQRVDLLEFFNSLSQQLAKDNLI